MGRYGKTFILEVDSTTDLGHILGYIFHPFPPAGLFAALFLLYT